MKPTVIVNGDRQDRERDDADRQQQQAVGEVAVHLAVLEEALEPGPDRVQRAPVLALERQPDGVVLGHRLAQDDRRAVALDARRGRAVAAIVRTAIGTPMNVSSEPIAVLQPATATVNVRMPIGRLSSR